MSFHSCFVAVCHGAYEVRLNPPDNEPGATNKGTVEIRFNATSPWGSLCDDGLDLADANVICKMLGFK